jgi:hypothetical protein
MAHNLRKADHELRACHRWSNYSTTEGVVSLNLWIKKA